MHTLDSGSPLGPFYLPDDIDNVWKHFWLSQLRGGKCWCWCQWALARDAANSSTMRRTDLPRSHSVPQANTYLDYRWRFGSSFYLRCIWSSRGVGHMQWVNSEKRQRIDNLKNVYSKLIPMLKFTPNDTIFKSSDKYLMLMFLWWFLMKQNKPVVELLELF